MTEVKLTRAKKLIILSVLYLSDTSRQYLKYVEIDLAKVKVGELVQLVAAARAGSFLCRNFFLRLENGETVGTRIRRELGEMEGHWLSSSGNSTKLTRHGQFVAKNLRKRPASLAQVIRIGWPVLDLTRRTA